MSRYAHFVGWLNEFLRNDDDRQEEMSKLNYPGSPSEVSTCLTKGLCSITEKAAQTWQLIKNLAAENVQNFDSILQMQNG